MKNAAVFDGNTSKSNGSMMRATPLGVYGYKLTDDELALIVASDSDLSHCSASSCVLYHCHR